MALIVATVWLLLAVAADFFGMPREVVRVALGLIVVGYFLFGQLDSL